MATRPVFIPVSSGDQLVDEKLFEFTWHPGMAPSQKKKNIAALHTSVKSSGIKPILEVSTKSEQSLGVALSAFNLKVDTTEGLSIFLEGAFQGSKIFKDGGPFRDLYYQSGKEIKRDDRLKSSGELIGFSFDGLQWELEPKTAFYDWLYVQAVFRNSEIGDAINKYRGFTDIEFNPKKSINCQARSCALFVSLQKRGILEKTIKDRDKFLDLLLRDAIYQSHSISNKQSLLPFE